MGEANVSGEIQVLRAPHFVLGAIFVAGISGLALLNRPQPVTASDITSTDVEPRVERRVAISVPTLCATLTARPAPTAEPVRVAAAAPLAESRKQNASSATPRTELVVSCSPTSYQLIGCKLEKIFEQQAPGIDVVLQIRDDRDSVGQVIVDSADAALISGDLSDRERTHKLRESVLGYQIVVPVIHRENPIQSITQVEIGPLLEGKHSDWRQLGHDFDGDILPVCRSLPRVPDTASHTLRFHGSASSVAAYVRSPREILSYVANQPRALGLCTWNEARGERDVRVLEIAHVKPTLENFLRGAWPLGCAMRIVTADEPKDPARVFAAFVASREVRRVLARHLVLPR